MGKMTLALQLLIRVDWKKPLVDKIVLLTYHFIYHKMIKDMYVYLYKRPKGLLEVYLKIIEKFQ